MFKLKVFNLIMCSTVVTSNLFEHYFFTLTVLTEKNKHNNWNNWIILCISHTSLFSEKIFEFEK